MSSRAFACDDKELVDSHIEAFIMKFVFGNKRERVRQRLLPIENNQWEEARHKIIIWLEPKTCFRLTGQDKLPQSLSAKYGNKAGLYFDFTGKPTWLTLQEASIIHSKDALFSLDSGKLVFFFINEDDVYVCKPA